jgi:hypothetical protein
VALPVEQASEVPVAEAMDDLAVRESPSPWAKVLAAAFCEVLEACGLVAIACEEVVELSEMAGLDVSAWAAGDAEI